MARTYNLDDFLDACADPNRVTVHHDAQEGARSYFHLYTEKDLLTFINGRGLENLQYINTMPWDFNPHKPPDIDIDAYSFYSGMKYGYIAFMYVPKTGKWRIKSFKPNSKPNIRELRANLRYLPFEGLSNVIDVTAEEK
jgi:hypothetical protein